MQDDERMALIIKCRPSQCNPWPCPCTCGSFSRTAEEDCTHNNNNNKSLEPSFHMFLKSSNKWWLTPNLCVLNSPNPRAHLDHYPLCSSLLHSGPSVWIDEARPGSSAFCPHSLPCLILGIADPELAVEKLVYTERDGGCRGLVAVVFSTYYIDLLPFRLEEIEAQTQWGGREQTQQTESEHIFSCSCSILPMTWVLQAPQLSNPNV